MTWQMWVILIVFIVAISAAFYGEYRYTLWAQAKGWMQ